MRGLLRNPWHVIAGATLVEVRRHGEADRFQAHVLWVSHSPDLALLTVDTPEQPTPSASRAAWSLASRIKAARTAGWSCWRRRSTPRSTQATPAGPCWPPGAWSVSPTRASGGSQSISYMIPMPVVRQFLHLLTLLVTALVPGSDAARVLRPRDVITSIDGKAIGNDKNIEFRPRGRTSYRLLCDLKQVGEAVQPSLLHLWRPRLRPPHEEPAQLPGLEGCSAGAVGRGLPERGCPGARAGTGGAAARPGRRGQPGLRQPRTGNRQDHRRRSTA